MDLSIGEKCLYLLYDYNQMLVLLARRFDVFTVSLRLLILQYKDGNIIACIM